MPVDEYVYFVLRLAIGCVCLWGALSKVGHVEALRATIAGFDLVPPATVPVAATIVILAEVAAGVLLILDLWPVAAALGAAALFVAFSVGILRALLRQQRIPCHCFGPSPLELTSPATLGRVIALIALSTWLTGLAGGDVPVPAPADAVPLASVSLGLVLSLRLVTFLPQTLASFRQRPVMTPSSTSRISLAHAPLTAVATTRDGAGTNGRSTGD